MAKKGEKTDYAPRIANRRAHHDYHIQEKLEVGISLRGTEVKSVRLGRVSLAEGYVSVDPRTMELWLHSTDIALYPHAAEHDQHDPKRRRKLLAHKREINRLFGQTTSKGVTLVPLAMYFRHGRAKIEIALATGKKKHDKRESLKEKQADREIRRAMTRKTI